MYELRQYSFFKLISVHLIYTIVYIFFVDINCTNRYAL